MEKSTGSDKTDIILTHRNVSDTFATMFLNDHVRRVSHKRVVQISNHLKRMLQISYFNIKIELTAAIDGVFFSVGDG